MPVVTLRSRSARRPWMRIIAAALAIAMGTAMVASGPAEAVVGDDDATLADARSKALAALGPESFVTAAAVAANFQRMVRIADSTGIPLDGVMDAVSADLREDLDLARFGSSANTRAAGAAKRAAGRLLRPVLTTGLRWMARRRTRSG